MNLVSHTGHPAANDPAYRHELVELEARCRTYLAAIENGDFDQAMLAVGMVIAQCGVVWKLAPPAGLFDPAELFRRET